MRILTQAAALAAALLGAATAAQASPYPGSLVTFTKGASDTQNLFSLSGNTVTATGDITGANTYYLGGVQLVGFRSLYLVNPDGSVPAGVATIAGGGYVLDGTTHAPTTYIDGTSNFGSNPGYDDNGPGKGFPDGSHFFVAANPTLAGKLSSNNDTSGSFTFSGPITGYDIGLDYILAGGVTGRAYFQAPVSSVPSRQSPTPEPSSMAAFAFGGLGLLGLTLRARRQKRAA